MKVNLNGINSFKECVVKTQVRKEGKAIDLYIKEFWVISSTNVVDFFKQNPSVTFLSINWVSPNNSTDNVLVFMAHRSEFKL